MKKLITALVLSFASPVSAQVIINDDLIDPELRWMKTQSLVTPQGLVNPQVNALVEQNVIITCVIPGQTVFRATEPVIKSTAWKREPRYEVHSTVFVPKNTFVVVPVLQGWEMSYGMKDYTKNSWLPDDEHWGLGSANVFVQELVQQTGYSEAKIRSVMTLMDDNADDIWSGKVNFTLICLGFVRSPLELFNPDDFRLPLAIQPGE